MTEELKPCPFCGSTDSQIRQISRRHWRISCTSTANCEVDIVSRTSADACVKAWNTRATPPPAQPEDKVTTPDEKSPVKSPAEGAQEDELTTAAESEAYMAGFADGAAGRAAWQLIETAPKDGTNVLLINRAGNMAAGLWLEGVLGHGWFLRGGNGPDAFFNGAYGPTHWMPLPAAPKEKPE